MSCVFSISNKTISFLTELFKMVWPLLLNDKDYCVLTTAGGCFQVESLQGVLITEKVPWNNMIWTFLLNLTALYKSNKSKLLNK